MSDVRDFSHEGSSIVEAAIRRVGGDRAAVATIVLCVSGWWPDMADSGRHPDSSHPSGSKN